jgi:hypothetical protein
VQFNTNAFYLFNKSATLLVNDKKKRQLVITIITNPKHTFHITVNYT